MREKIELYKGKITIWFVDEEWVKGHGYIRHGYFHPKNGGPDFNRRIVSSTGATGMIDKSTPMKYWAVNLSIDFLVEKLKAETEINFELLEEARKQHTLFLKKAADIGTQVHDWVEGFVKYELKIGKKPKMPENEKVANGVNGFLQWRGENKIEFIESEKFVYSRKYDFGGKLDIKALVDGKLTLLDCKTCNMWKKDKKKPDGFARDKDGNLIKSPVYDEQRYQAASYLLADEEENKKVYKGDRIILRLDKEFGEFDPVQLDDYDRDKKGFLAALKLKKLKRN